MHEGREGEFFGEREEVNCTEEEEEEEGGRIIKTKSYD